LTLKSFSFSYNFEKLDWIDIIHSSNNPMFLLCFIILES